MYVSFQNLLHHLHHSVWFYLLANQNHVASFSTVLYVRFTSPLVTVHHVDVYPQVAFLVEHSVRTQRTLVRSFARRRTLNQVVVSVCFIFVRHHVDVQVGFLGELSVRTDWALERFL